MRVSVSSEMPVERWFGNEVTLTRAVVSVISAITLTATTLSDGLPPATWEVFLLLILFPIVVCVFGTAAVLVFYIVGWFVSVPVITFLNGFYIDYRRRQGNAAYEISNDDESFLREWIINIVIIKKLNI